MIEIKKQLESFMIILIVIHTENNKCINVHNINTVNAKCSHESNNPKVTPMTTQY